jgi:hypothetical protein
MGGRANIFRGIVQDEVLEMDELAIDPQRSTGVGEMGALDPSRSDRRAGDALIETHCAMLSGGKGLNSNRTDLFHEQLTI